MAITFIRIDDRIIHGQIVTRWAMENPCDGLLGVDDKAATNEIIKSALKSASTRRTLIYTVDEFVSKFEEAARSSKNYFLITKDIFSLNRILEKVDHSLLPKKVNIGPQSAVASEKTYNINRNADLTEDEIRSYDKLHKMGFEIEFRLVPDSPRVNWSNIRKKFEEINIL